MNPPSRRSSFRSLLLLFASTCALLGATRATDVPPPNLLSTPTNRIVDVNSSCSAHAFSVSVTMERPFKGVVFARDFSQECRSQGALNEMVTLNMPSSGCGVRLISDRDDNATDASARDDGDAIAGLDGSLYYTVTLIVQMDRFLRQISDQERVVTCYLDGEDTKVHSDAMRRAIVDGIRRDGRRARMRTDQAESPASESSNSVEMRALEHARAWMELAGEEDDDGGGGGSSSSSTSSFPSNERADGLGVVQVGDTMVLTVKSTLPANIGWRVIDCFAHDGIGDSSQRLLDESGCPIDESILPALRMSRPRAIGPARARARGERAIVKKTGEELKRFADERTDAGYMRYQEAFASFPAFKFPDRDRLHLSCGLQLCRGDCQKIDCGGAQRSSRNLAENDARAGRRNVVATTASNVDVADDIIDRLEVFNSVEVIAPGIELDGYRRRGASSLGGGELVRRPRVTASGDRTFCMSTNRMALAFCALGVIFIVAVLVALGALIRARRGGRVHYSRSVFSSSGASGSACGGSRLLLQESPCLGTSRGVRWPY